MVDVTFVFTNPRHHLEMMAPVARELGRRGVECRLLSLAELRGFETPKVDDLAIRRLIPFNLRRNPKVGAASADGKTGGARALARSAVAAVLIPIIRRAIGKTRAVVVPNDAAYPYDRLLAAAHGVPIVLMQEGIRFPMPNVDEYGTGGAALICAWGTGSRDLFVTRGVSPDRIAITGSPRHDPLEPRAWQAAGDQLLERLGLTTRPLALVTNPIEHQGYGTVDGKLALITEFLREAEPVLRARKLSVVVKNHAQEDAASFAALAARSSAASLIHVDTSAPLFAALAATCGAVLLTSTAGIEALLFDVPIGVLELPNGAPGFEYVERGAAVGLRRGHVAEGLARMLDDREPRRAAEQALVERHLHDRGNATRAVADAITRVLR